MKKKTTPTEAKLIAAAIANTFPKRTRKTPCRKGGMLDVALAKVRELKGEIKRLSDDLIESHHRNRGLRDANAHASSVCSEAQAAERVLTDALNRSTVEIDQLKSANESLYDGTKLVEADFQKRLEVGQLQVDQLQDRIAELKRQLANAREGNELGLEILNKKDEELNKKDLQIANLQHTIERERASHTMTFLAKSERIDELLIIEKALTDRLHSIWKRSTEKSPSTFSKVWSWLTQIR